jgi:hypothetical protein
MTPEDLLVAIPDAHAVVVQQLRKLVTSVVPEAAERVYPVWRGIGYRHPEAGYLCGIFLFKDHVGLAFEFGALLPDPQGLLRRGRTSSKSVRYLEFRNKSDVRASVVSQFLTAAVSLKAMRSDKGSKGRRRRRTRDEQTNP